MSLPYLVRCDPKDGGCDEVYPGDLEECPKCSASTVIMSIPEQIDLSYFVYDIETYPTAFTMCVTHPASCFEWEFEISIRKNDYMLFNEFMNLLQRLNATMVGYHNIHFDYPVIHFIYNKGVSVTVAEIYHLAMSIISGKPQKMIWDNQRLVNQLDLFKINHFDNKAKRTSLKALEIYMRMKSIKDLPFPPGTILNSQQIDQIIPYNKHDVLATTYFLMRCLEMITFRAELSLKYNINFTNMSDSKIGSEIFIKKLNDQGIQTHFKDSFNRKQALQTVREQVSLIECIPNYIYFQSPEFQAILTQFKATTLVGDNVKKLFSKFTCEHQGIEYVFGGGGIHACRKGKYESDELMIIVDVDVEGYYPNLIIKNSYYPEHLGNNFPPIFGGIIEERLRVGKKSTLGKGLKISANGTYGNMGNKYSPFYDLKCLLSVTLTGQLSLLMLIEQTLEIPSCTVIQANTDGYTVLIPRMQMARLEQIVSDWEKLTNLKMEYVYYSRLFIQDVNNYIAEYQ